MDPTSETVTGTYVEVLMPLVMAVLYVALFSWLAVVGWAIQRRKEREAYYRHETENKLVDQSRMTADQIVKLRQDEEHVRWLRRREGLKLGGLMTAALGVGILVCLQLVDTGGVSLGAIGLIPLIIGAALLLYAYVLYPKVTDLIRPLSQPPGEEEDEPRR